MKQTLPGKKIMLWITELELAFVKIGLARLLTEQKHPDNYYFVENLIHKIDGVFMKDADEKLAIHNQDQFNKLLDRVMLAADTHCKRITKMREFAKFVIEASWDSMDVDAGDIHEKAVELGLIASSDKEDEDGNIVYELTEVVTGSVGANPEVAKDAESDPV